MALFNGPTAGCAACHRDYGRQDTYRYDVWGAVVKVHDLTRGEFRWGKDPATIAARVRHGIPPAGMPASSSLTDGQVADLVSFVRELGYPQRLPPDVREKVYPTGKPVQP
jgi:mono/diheme cytochrome c family protein